MSRTALNPNLVYRPQQTRFVADILHPVRCRRATNSSLRSIFQNERLHRQSLNRWQGRRRRHNDRTVHQPGDRF